MKSNGGVLSADEVVHQPITTVLSGPAAGALGAAVVAEKAGFAQVVTCDGGGTSTDVTVVIDGEPALTTEGNVGAYPSKIPMIDVVTVGAGGGSIAWVSPEGTLKVGPQSAGAEPGPMCYGGGGEEPTVTDAHAVLGRIPPHLLGGEVPLDVDLAAKGVATLAEQARSRLRAVRDRHPGDLGLEPGQRAAPDHRQPRPGRPRLHDGHVRRLRLAAGLPADGHPRPATACSSPTTRATCPAFGLLTVDVRNDYVRTAVARQSALDTATVQGILDDLAGQADAALGREGFAPEQRVFQRTADLRYYGQAYEVRVEVPEGDVDADLLAGRRRRFHDEHKALYDYDFRDDARQEVEWVNLRVTGIGPIRKPEVREVAAGSGAESAAHRHPPGLLRRLGGDRGLRPCVPRRRRRGHRPGGRRGVRLHRPAAPGVHRPGRRVRQPRRHP